MVHRTFVLLVFALLFASCIGCPAVASMETGVLIQSTTSGPIDANSEGSPIVGARVSLYDDDVLIAEYVTLENGSYEIGFGDACADRGTLTVHFEAEGYETLVLEWTEGYRTIGLVPST